MKIRLNLNLQKQPHRFTKLTGYNIGEHFKPNDSILLGFYTF